MMPRWFNGLRVQFVLLLTLALFPLAAIAIYQTSRVENEAARNAELAVLALTRSAAKEEELFIERALGVARFFGTVAEDFIDNPARCVRDLQNFIENNDNYSSIGIIPLSGAVTCMSAGGAYDATTGPYFADLMEAQQRTIVANPRGVIRQESIFNIFEPFEIDSEFAGFISIAIPHRGMPKASLDLEELGLVDLITFNSDDDVLTARNSLENAPLEMPVDWTHGRLPDLLGSAFEGKNRKGENRTFTVVPILGSDAVVLGVWRTQDGFAWQISRILKPAIFPLLMWVASMAVAMLTIHRLVLRHITHLRKNMDDFAETRIIKTSAPHAPMPNELRALAKNFEVMTDEVLREEAELEDIAREKNVLIKEVHHRVKNNLQLISSIMNMKIRAAEHDETKSVLMRLQDRVLSLASIHRDLYQSKNGGRTNVGALISDIVENSIEVAAATDTAIDTHTDLDPVLLYPDQAVPLALLVAEGMTNALKYSSATNAPKPFIKVSLRQVDADCILTLENSISAAADVEGTGLGAKLINAFAIQLSGRIEVLKDDELYTLKLRFKVQEFVPDGRDF